LTHVNHAPSKIIPVTLSRSIRIASRDTQGSLAVPRWGSTSSAFFPPLGRALLTPRRGIVPRCNDDGLRSRDRGLTYSQSADLPRACACARCVNPEGDDYLNHCSLCTCARTLIQTWGLRRARIFRRNFHTSCQSSAGGSG